VRRRPRFCSCCSGLRCSSSADLAEKVVVVAGTMGGGRNMLGGEEVEGSGERVVVRGVRSDSGSGELALWR